MIDKILTSSPYAYPYLVCRIMTAVYASYPIEFVHNASIKPDKGFFAIVSLEPFQNDGTLKSETRETLITIVSNLCTERHARMCLVFGPKDAVYCEPDGSVNPKDDIPVTTRWFNELRGLSVNNSCKIE